MRMGKGAAREVTLSLLAAVRSRDASVLFFLVSAVSKLCSVPRIPSLFSHILYPQFCQRFKEITSLPKLERGPYLD
jgi:hypothetical protein